jgi:hypothetical protein
MELILKSNNENSIAKIIALAHKLNVAVEQRGSAIENEDEKEELKKRILNYKATENPSFSDPLEWERNERKDRELPFSE